ncbi:MAG TPA: class I SAM-dependent methyltransferase [Flavobacteriaceae bacterium]|nr:class I SAM-dependent methyltransferase [Flavobacteriaceae bacterium]
MPKGFDNASKEYDQEFTFSKIGIAQRDRVYTNINHLILNQKKLSILEFNCGTGEDAIKFAKLGHEVLATDISSQMIEIGNSKAQMNNLNFKVQDINLIKPEDFNQKFDLVFSNFGGLNCLPKEQLAIFFNNCFPLLKPQGKLVLVVMSKKCLWEIFYFYLKGKFKSANRRNTNNSIEINVHGTTIKTYYYNPKDIVSLTKKLFVVKNIKPIGIMIPPSYLENSILTKGIIFKMFINLEKLFSFSALAKYADHFIIELEKR